MAGTAAAECLCNGHFGRHPHNVRDNGIVAKKAAYVAIGTDLKPVYRAPTEEIALVALDEFEAKRGKKYPLGVKSWRMNCRYVIGYDFRQLLHNASFLLFPT